MLTCRRAMPPASLIPIIAAAALFIHAPAAADYKSHQSGNSKVSKPTKFLTVDDVINMESAGDFDISTDGKWAAWVKSSPNKSENKRQRNIHLASLADTVSFQLTRGEGSDHAPEFSPDGSALAFLRSGAKAKPQIYIIRIGGGEPEKLTGVKAGVTGFAWRSDDEILFTAREDSTLRETKLRSKKDDAMVVADQEHYTPVRLFSIDRKTKKIKRLTTNDGVIREFGISPDGRWVVTNENQDINYSYDNRVPPRQFLMDIETGTRREILAEPHVNPSGFKWDNESRGFYCRRPVASDSTETYVSIYHLCYYDIDRDRLEKVDLGWENGLGYSYHVVKNGFIAELAGGVRKRIAYVRRTRGNYKKTFLESPSGKAMSLLAGERFGSRIIYSVSNASAIPEITTAVMRGGKLKDERKLLDLNEALKKKTLSRCEVVSWTGALGESVDGILYYPPDFKEGTRRPLVVNLHGGPAGTDYDFFSERWSNYPHLLASRGTFVLKVNYHGSGAYGLEWVESIKGHYYEYEVPDILNGIDHLIREGLVDENKIGIMGWSNGSILAIECCLRSERFKVLCAGAGDVNWISDYGNCAFGAGFDNAYFGGPPWENPETYIDKSPIFRMDEMSTPTLIMFGTQDTNVPTEQGWQQFRALQQIGKTPVRFLLFPGATHGLAKLSQQKRKVEEELIWFDRYLFGTYEEKNEGFEEDSPLGLALKRSHASSSDRLLGETVDGVLVPETVLFNEIRIGRFEVTRAQFAEFDTSYAYPPGTGNHPANGIPFEEALEYCAWLSSRTGRSFRLPTREEMTKILKAAEPNLSRENNMEHWAGYSPTPEEREMLKEKIAELEGKRLLLEEAGSFKPAGEEGVYDLGGNVAEWVTGPEGKGEIMGLSAVSTKDSRLEYTPPPRRYVGLRVCED